jgi:hypothetical protein
VIVGYVQHGCGVFTVLILWVNFFGWCLFFFGLFFQKTREAMLPFF